MNPIEIQKQLDQFTGTSSYHQVTIGYVCTDGALFLAEKCGCFWLIDLISSYKFEPNIKNQEFLVYKLRVNHDHSAIITAEDGNDNVLISQEIPYTDFPLSSIDIWVANSVIYLPSEH